MLLIPGLDHRTTRVRATKLFHLILQSPRFYFSKGWAQGSFRGSVVLSASPKCVPRKAKVPSLNLECQPVCSAFHRRLESICRGWWHCGVGLAVVGTGSTSGPCSVENLFWRPLFLLSYVGPI